MNEHTDKNLFYLKSVLWSLTKDTLSFKLTFYGIV